MTVEHSIRWTSPAPLWSEAAGADAGRFFGQPAILRFTTDSFMDEFLAMLREDPHRLRSLLAQRETWWQPLDASTGVTGSAPAPSAPRLARKLERFRIAASRSVTRATLPATIGDSPPRLKADGEMLKLFQPGHQRYYLVSSCLVCGTVGMPDRAVDPGREERVSFVIRRMLPPGRLQEGEALPEFDAFTWEEHAFTTGPAGAQWRRIGPSSDPSVRSAAADEERLPLFGVRYQETDDRMRRLFAGLIPVGRREAYVGAAIAAKANGSPPSAVSFPKTSRKILFRSRVAEPWKNVIDQAQRFKAILSDPSASSARDEERAALRKVAREQIQTQSWLVLSDCADFLSRHVRDVWDAIENPSKEDELDPQGPGRKLLDALKSTTAPRELKDALTAGSPYLSSDVKECLRDALRAVSDEQKLDEATGSYDRDTKGGAWPEWLFPLSDPEIETPTFSRAAAPVGEEDDDDSRGAIDTFEPEDVAAAKRCVDTLVALVVRAMPTEPTEPSPPIPAAAQRATDLRDGIFVIRALFERPCCGRLAPAVMSEPSRPFRLAGFFDYEAPARPIRIALPIDTSPAGLSKFDKNTAFMISDVLCGQIQRAKGLSLGDLVRSVLPWPFHKDLSVPDRGPCNEGSVEARIGMICSLSIPIVTICALILVMIIVNLLDVMFRWVPYFIMCFPLRGLKAKK